MTRRGFMNTVGCPKVELKRLSVASPSSAVSLSRLSRSINSSTRPTPPNRSVLDTRRSLVLAPFDGPAQLPLVVGAEQPRLVVADSRLGGRAKIRPLAEH